MFKVSRLFKGMVFLEGGAEFPLFLQQTKLIEKDLKEAIVNCTKECK